MSNVVCKELEEVVIPTKELQPTLMDLYVRLNKLELENEMLKANSYELKKENLQLRSDNQELHNKLNGNSEYTTMVDGIDDLSYMDEYAEGNEELMAKMYEVTGDDYKFGGHDIKNI